MADSGGGTSKTFEVMFKIMSKLDATFSKNFSAAEKATGKVAKATEKMTPIAEKAEKAQKKLAETTEKVTPAADEASKSHEKLSDRFKKTWEQAKKLFEQTKKTGEETKEAGEKAEKMGKKMKDSSGGVEALIKKLAGIQVVAKLARAGFDLLKKGVTDCMEAWKVQAMAENELAFAMQKNGSVDAEIAAVKEYAGVLQQYTTVGDEVSLVGARVLANYGLQSDGIKELMPVMADMGVKMHGISVNGEQMAEISKKMGEAVTGDIGPLKELGYVFDENTKKNWATMSAQKRLNLIVGQTEKQFAGLAGELRNQPEGRVQAMKNSWGDLQELLGQKLVPIQEKVIAFIESKLPAVEGLINNVSGTIEDLTGPIKWVMDTARDLFGAFTGGFKGLSPEMDTAKGQTQTFGEKLQGAFDRAQPIIDWLKNEALPKVGEVIGTVTEKATEFGRYVADNWDKIAPVVLNLSAAIAGLVIGIKVAKGVAIAYTTVTGLMKAATMLSTGATLAETAAKYGLNTALLAAVGGIVAHTAALAASKVAAFASAAAQWVLNGALLACPITWIILGIMALIAVIWLIVENWDQVSAALTAAWEFLVETFGGVFESIRTTVAQAWENVQAIWAGIQEFFGNLLAGVVALFQGKWKEAGEHFTKAFEALKTVWDGVTKFFTDLWKGISDIFRNFIEGVKNFFAPVVDWIKDKFEGIGKFFDNLLGKGKKIGDTAAKVPTGGGPQIAAYASGGWVTKPTYALIGEGRADEAVIAMDGSARSRTIWAQAGERLGMYEQRENQAADIKPARLAPTSSKSSETTITYAPTYHIAGGAPSEVKAQVMQADAMSREEFRRMQERFEAEKRRLEDA